MSFGSFQMTTSLISGLVAQEIGDEAAVLGARHVRPWRVARLAVHADDDPEAAGVELELVEEALVPVGDAASARAATAS